MVLTIGKKKICEYEDCGDNVKVYYNDYDGSVTYTKDEFRRLAVKIEDDLNRSCDRTQAPDVQKVKQKIERALIMLFNTKNPFSRYGYNKVLIRYYKRLGHHIFDLTNICQRLIYDYTTGRIHISTGNSSKTVYFDARGLIDDMERYTFTTDDLVFLEYEIEKAL